MTYRDHPIWMDCNCWRIAGPKKYNCMTVVPCIRTSNSTVVWIIRRSLLGKQNAVIQMSTEKRVEYCYN